MSGVFLSRRFSQVCFLLLFTHLIVLVGCGERTAQMPANESNAFDGSSAEVKQAWEKALAAEKAKDYVAAQTAFSGISQMPLSEQQRTALNEERAMFGQRLTQAADKNDPAAVEALKMAIKDRGPR